MFALKEMPSSGLDFFLLFARLSGFFLISPLFSGKALSKMVRLGLAFGCSLSIAPPLLMKFNFSQVSHSFFIIHLFKEAAIGYVVGFIFSLIVEAAAFAGQLVGTLTGFSATELLDPLSSSSHPLLARFFSLIIFTLFFTLDLHHPLLRLLYESFEAVPLKAPLFTKSFTFTLIELSRLLFHQALKFAFLPLLILLMLTVIFAFLSRFFSIFWIGFPLQLLVGLAAIGASVSWFAPLLEQSFFHFFEIVKKFIVNF